MVKDTGQSALIRSVRNRWCDESGVRSNAALDMWEYKFCRVHVDEKVYVLTALGIKKEKRVWHILSRVTASSWIWIFPVNRPLINHHISTCNTYYSKHKNSWFRVDCILSFSLTGIPKRELCDTKTIVGIVEFWRLVTKARLRESWRQPKAS
jgi:hypothetical protein